MRLPAKLLGCMRVGVGVGAVMLGGCDLVDEAKARALGEEEAVAEQTAADPAPQAQPTSTPDSPEPMLLGRSPLATAVEQAVTRATPTAPPPINDLGDLDRPSTPPSVRSTTEPEGSRPFIPYDDGTGTLALAPLTTKSTKTTKPRPRKSKVARPVDEPCDPQLVAVDPPRGKWDCPACGRG
ncbi:hypothetical protein [Paraliomyxa miuraensis]|uniref:hypothetical protein n=1 Tax=Paraliomyxa miuraensis TaxID=376150 RepID=UPI0022553BCB|nr:hypothetical protein [Paraliomyxa miuraensis]MCX4239924.1 hypothetical protein [Paraliomyxa miuraensis]